MSQDEEKQRKDKDKEEKDKRRAKITIELDMERINYARVKKVGASTTDIRFRDPERTAARLGIKPDDDFVILPTPDRSKILLIRVDKVVTPDTLRDKMEGFFTPAAIERIYSTITEERLEWMGEATSGAKPRRLTKRRRRIPKM
jgi:hypothetical protein